MIEKPLILLLESSTSVCSVAISRGGELLAVKETAEGNKHSQWMTLYVQDTLAETGFSYEDLDLIAVSAGPGSYTGLRVAYSIAKGIAYSRGLPMVEVNTLDSLYDAYIYAKKVTARDVVIPSIDARRMEVYWQATTTEGKRIKSIEAHILNEDSFDEFQAFDKIVVVGNGAAKMHQIELPADKKAKLVIEDFICSAAHLRFSAMKKWQNKAFSDVAYCNPQYLKSPNITQPKKKMLI